MPTAPFMRTFFIGIFVLAGAFSVSAQIVTDNRKTFTDTVFNVGDMVKLPGITFEFDKCMLRKESMDSIKPLFVFLKAHPSYIIEIGNHTDYEDPSYSQRLTYCRARSLRDSLLRWGIDPLRIVATGWGDTKPYVLQSDFQLPSGKIAPKGSVLTEVFRKKYIVDRYDYELLRMLCRRTEIKILSTNFGK